MLICKITSTESNDDGLLVSYQNYLDDILINEGKNLYSMSEADDIDTLATKIQDDFTKELNVLYKNMAVNKRNKDIMNTLAVKLLGLKIEIASDSLGVKI